MPLCHSVLGTCSHPFGSPRALSLSLFTDKETETQREVAFPGLSRREQQG